MASSAQSRRAPASGAGRLPWGPGASGGCGQEPRFVLGRPGGARQHKRVAAEPCLRGSRLLTHDASFRVPRLPGVVARLWALGGNARAGGKDPGPARRTQVRAVPGAAPGSQSPRSPDGGPQGTRSRLNRRDGGLPARRDALLTVNSGQNTDSKCPEASDTGVKQEPAPPKPWTGIACEGGLRPEPAASDGPIPDGVELRQDAAVLLG